MCRGMSSWYIGRSNPANTAARSFRLPVRKSQFLYRSEVKSAMYAKQSTHTYWYQKCIVGCFLAKSSINPTNQLYVTCSLSRVLLHVSRNSCKSDSDLMLRNFFINEDIISSIFSSICSGCKCEVYSDKKYL